MNINELIRPHILHLEPYHSAREKVQEGVLLDANENPYPQLWQGVLLNRYPDPLQRRLRQALADYVGVGVENVVAGTGSDEVLDWIFKVFCNPGEDWVAIMEPTYGMYQITAQIFGIPVFQLLLDESFQFEAERFLKKILPQVKVVFLCSPNNPTGNLLDGDEILKLCREVDKVVVVDEAYVEFSESSSLAGYLDSCPNLILLRTLSKAFGNAALRLGYAVASPEIISCFLKVKAPYNLNSVTLARGLEALNGREDRARQVKEIRDERERVRTRLSRIPGVKVVFPSQANFLLFRCGDASEVCQLLLQRGIVVRDRSSSPLLDNCIRVSVGVPDENDLFLNELERILKRG